MAFRKSLEGKEWHITEQKGNSFHASSFQRRAKATSFKRLHCPKRKACLLISKHIDYRDLEIYSMFSSIKHSLLAAAPRKWALIFAPNNCHATSIECRLVSAEPRLNYRTLIWKKIDGNRRLVKNASRRAFDRWMAENDTHLTPLTLLLVSNEMTTKNHSKTGAFSIHVVPQHVAAHIKVFSHKCTVENEYLNITRSLMLPFGPTRPTKPTRPARPTGPTDGCIIFLRFF